MNYKVGLDNLKPEVREAVEDLRTEMELCAFGISEQSSIETVITELVRLSGIEAELRKNEAVALKRRIAAIGAAHLMRDE